MTTKYFSFTIDNHGLFKVSGCLTPLIKLHEKYFFISSNKLFISFSLFLLCSTSYNIKLLLLCKSSIVNNLSIIKSHQYSFGLGYIWNKK